MIKQYDKRTVLIERIRNLSPFSYIPALQIANEKNERKILKSFSFQQCHWNSILISMGHENSQFSIGKSKKQDKFSSSSKDRCSCQIVVFHLSNNWFINWKWLDWVPFEYLIRRNIHIQSNPINCNIVRSTIKYQLFHSICGLKKGILFIYSFQFVETIYVVKRLLCHRR